MLRASNAILCGVTFLICTSVTFGQRADILPEALRVQTKLVKSKFQLGEPVLFSVIISNVGTQPFLIPNRITFFDDAQGVLSAKLKSLSGNPITGRGMASDCLDYKPTKLLYETVLNEYLLLRPGTSYVQQVSLGGLYNDLRPGMYLLEARYSAGFYLLGCQRWIEEDIEHFPLPAWHGTAAANGVSFTILPSTKKR